MDFKLMKSFLKDQSRSTIAYFLGNFLIGFFYYIDNGKKIEIIYPLALVIFVYLVWMLITYMEYRRFYQGLEEMIKYHDFQEDYSLVVNQRAAAVIRRLHADYLDQLSMSENDRKKDRRFLSLWIHNMKTPVTVTSLVLQRMEQKEIEADAGLPALKEENKKLLESLDTVLNMIRLEDFAKDYIPEQIDLVKELKDIINKNKSLFIYNSVFPKIITDLPEAVILSDRKWNELMITQIISNGVKYSRSGDGSSKNIYFHIERDKGKINLMVRDEGIGIPGHDLEKVFEPFFTGDNGRKGYQSSGIGLYFCKEVCNLLGHTLTITSEVDKGTTVLISYLAKL